MQPEWKGYCPACWKKKRKEWLDKNPERRREINRKRNAKKHRTPEQEREIWIKRQRKKFGPDWVPRKLPRHMTPDELTAHLEERKRKKRERERMKRAKNPEVYALRKRLQNQRRRANGVGGGGKFCRAQFLLMWDCQKGKCALCGSDLVDFHCDHILPLSRGGGNDFSNIQILCPTCNLKKGTMTNEEFKTSKFFPLPVEDLTEGVDKV